MKIKVVMIIPMGWIYASALSEAAQAVAYTFSRLGFDTELTVNDFEDGALHVIFGAHLLSREDISALPSDCIIFNMEQLSQSNWCTPDYLYALKNYQVWDYSKQNLNFIKQHDPIYEPIFVPLGYVQELKRIRAAENQDIDVLFYGSINDRRARIIEALQERGLQVKVLTGVYGDERDEYISRSKVILNVHYYEDAIFESARIIYLMTNSKAIVSETSREHSDYRLLENGAIFTEYNELVDACVRLVNNSDVRRKLESDAFDAVSKISMEDHLRRVLNGETVGESVRSDLWLNLGSGKDYRKDCLNIDIQESVNPDLVLDLAKRDIIGRQYKCGRFGTINFEEGVFSRIFCNDVLEHVTDLVSLMTNCLELLRDEGTMEILVPYDLSYGAWQDPTHVRAFNERSWLYYTDWFWYLGWDRSRFDLVSLEYVLSERGNELSRQGVALEQITMSPRAVDSMRVVLSKRRLTIEEKQLLLRVMQGSNQTD